MLASGAKDTKIRLWDPSGACLAIGDGHAGAVSALAFSRKSPSFLVSGGVDKLLKVGVFCSQNCLSSLYLSTRVLEPRSCHLGHHVVCSEAAAIRYKCNLFVIGDHTGRVMLIVCKSSILSWVSSPAGVGCERYGNGC